MTRTSALIHRVQSRLALQLGLPRPWTMRRLLGHEVVLRDGTIPGKTDYDDAWFHACALRATNLFDVGANVGHSALMALLAPNVQEIVLVEANWEALAVAAENLIRNGLSARARFVGAFASHRPDEAVDFWTVGTGAAGSMYASHATSAARRNNVRKVSTTTIDQLAERFGNVPDLVKIDVEGAEHDVLRGSREVAGHQRTRYVVEMHSMAELTMATNAAQVLAWTRGVGYAAWYMAKAERLESEAAIQHRGRCHLLLQPREWPYPDWLATIPQSAELPA